MNYFRIVKSDKLGIYGKNGISKIRQKRSEERINEILLSSKMKFYHKFILFGTGFVALVMTNKEITREFAEQLHDSLFIDSVTKKPSFKLPRNWKMID